MAITGLHLLLTYQCNFECDHCFVYGSYSAQGVMKISDIRSILDQAKQVGSIEWIYFEGGEPFLYYPVMLWGLRKAKELAFKRGIVTNAYWAKSIEDAMEWLIPISEIGISDLSISDDSFHYGEEEENSAEYAHKAAKKLGLPVGRIITEDPRISLEASEGKDKTEVGGRVLFKGRAREKLIKGLPKKSWTKFNRCLEEDFSNQSRVHIDPFGFVHVCQGITIGNINQTQLAEIFVEFNPKKHPICGPILKGGPVELVKKFKVDHDEACVDECQLCYSIRLKLRKRFPNILAPNQMYGVE
jgi:MoaA/NifB/PqqE/SkfB family radical SAM enzyme